MGAAIGPQVIISHQSRVSCRGPLQTVKLSSLKLIQMIKFI